MLVGGEGSSKGGEFWCGGRTDAEGETITHGRRGNSSEVFTEGGKDLTVITVGLGDRTGSGRGRERRRGVGARSGFGGFGRGGFGAFRCVMPKEFIHSILVGGWERGFWLWG